MLLTTVDEYINERSPVKGGHARHLDRSTLLTPETVLFIGFADAPGPVRLKIRSAGDGNAWRVLHPRSGRAAQRTVFRMTIPVTLLPG